MEMNFGLYSLERKERVKESVKIGKGGCGYMIIMEMWILLKGTLFDN